ncbi:MAG TPA: circularly permuted type 2 ATP-grasp protein, partial [Polyangiales bacterium]
MPSLLSASYAPAPAAYDEMKAPDGRVRPHWLKLFEHVDAMGREELEQRWKRARHLLHENGVSYNVYGDPQGVERPWSLSPLPVLLPASEWHVAEAGLAQRARLLNVLLHDLYGAQRTLIEGLLPPELVFANPGFLRACHGVHVPRDNW